MEMDGPMVPIKRYGQNSFRPKIGVAELFSLAPAQTTGRRVLDGESSFAKIHKMAFWGSHGVYTQPGSFNESVAPFRGERYSDYNLNASRRSLVPSISTGTLQPTAVSDFTTYVSPK